MVRAANETGDEYVTRKELALYLTIASLLILFARAWDVATIQAGIREELQHGLRRVEDRIQAIELECLPQNHNSIEFHESERTADAARAIEEATRRIQERYK